MKTRKTPLNRTHREFGGRMVEFAGWELPVQYESVVEEHQAVRNGVGVFDVSHMGQLEICGKGAMDLMQRVTCNDVAKLEDGQAQYSAFLTQAGTFVDDIVVYRFSSERFLVCVNAATTEKDFSWVSKYAESRTEVLNRSDEFAQLAIQGPKADSVVQALCELDLSTIKFYRFAEDRVAGIPALISRTGYTGEKGFELYVPPSSAKDLWKKLFEAGKAHGIKAAGLAARNSLRLEMRYPLYGNDIDEDHTPLEAGLGWIVKFNKDFVGRRALEKQKDSGVKQKLTGFEMVEAGIARDGYTVKVDDREVGTVCSGGFSPSLGKSIGLLYLPVELAEPGQELGVDIRGRSRKARIVETPFYKRP